jgi:hypothetical protein
MTLPNSDLSAPNHSPAIAAMGQNQDLTAMVIMLFVRRRPIHFPFIFDNGGLASLCHNVVFG